MGFVYRTPDVIGPDQFIRYSDGRRTSHAPYSTYMNATLSSMYENGAAQSSKVHGYGTGSVGEYSMADTWIEH
ncbi:hypothetical protein [Bifidobacterium sp.]|uniref:hypothetical protein n=1 Tax=Bifidobacterium sp. TaxID=41200 RepID=UPI0025C5A4E4|nr:hypothetical protein [Bifidobacterium sp.]MCH4209828.1 hypothetical protein [Bifidobacterium sp.]MCI1224557.1 hypothetical protein [Bifidobacterium sp.]